MQAAHRPRSSSLPLVKFTSGADGCSLKGEAASLLPRVNKHLSVSRTLLESKAESLVRAAAAAVQVTWRCCVALSDRFASHTQRSALKVPWGTWQRVQAILRSGHVRCGPA